MPTEKDILNALSQIIDPDFNKDIVSLGFVKNIKIADGRVSLDIALTTPACPVRTEFQQKAEKLVGGLKGVNSVTVNLTTQTPQKHHTPQTILNSLSSVRSIVAVSSCKGGVGKSTVAAHVARELARRGFKVGLVDTDIHGPSIPALFNLHNVNVYANSRNQLIPIEHNGLKIMSFGFLLGDAPAVMRGPMVTRYVQQVLLHTEWGTLDYLFIDMPPGTGDVQLTITQSIRLTGAVIVTTPQTLSLIDVARGILMFERVQVPILGVVENMSYFICDQCQKKHAVFGRESPSLQERFGVELLAELPLLPAGDLTLNRRQAVSVFSQAVDNVVRAIGKKSIMPKEIPDVQSNNTDIILTWPDGKRAQVRNRDLRTACRCALCVHEETGKQILKPEDVPDDIIPKEIFPLGNYALGITWSDGHSSGIYPYELIKKISARKK